MRLSRSSGARSSSAKIWSTLILPSVLIVVFAQFTLLFFWFEPSSSASADSVTISCSSNGRIVVTSNTWPDSDPYWRASDLLNINLGFGNFSFASAKSIDICWDLIVGRGIQVVLCLLTYPVLRRSLISEMEQRPVLVRTYASVAFNNISVTAFMALLRDLYQGIRTTVLNRKDNSAKSHASILRWRYLLYCVIFGYVLLFPTLAAAMTGYQALFKPYAHLPGRVSPVELSELRIPSLVVRDGSRIGLHDNYPVFADNPRYLPLLKYSQELQRFWLLLHGNKAGLPNCYTAKTLLPDAHNINEASQGDKGCPLSYADVADLHNSFVIGSITFGDRTWVIPGKPLDVVSQGGTANGSSFPSLQFVSVDDAALDLADVQRAGLCQQSQHYIWGFSSLLLFVFCISTLLFAIILATLHYESFWPDVLSGIHYESSTYGDAIDLVYALEEIYSRDSLRLMSASAFKKTPRTSKQNASKLMSALLGSAKKD